MKKRTQCRNCRRHGEKLYLKGERCFSSKCPVEQGSSRPGQHGQRKGRESDYCGQLKGKQKARIVYGVGERQFRIIYETAEQMKGATGDNLIVLLERRLDNVVYRMGFGGSRGEARQLVSHRCITVNGKVVNIPSYVISEGDVIEVREKMKEQLRIKEALKNASSRGLPEWLEVNSNELQGKFKYIPARSAIQTTINERLIVELYSK